MVVAIKEIKRCMNHHDTAPSLASITIHIVHKLTQNKVDELSTQNFDNEPNRSALYRLVADQQEVGWDNLLKGRIAKG